VKTRVPGGVGRGADNVDLASLVTSGDRPATHARRIASAAGNSAPSEQKDNVVETGAGKPNSPHAIP
jgi:hypothetical protein